jgi:hypothetical protein
MPKITGQLALDLNLCYNQAQADAAHDASGSDPDGVTVDELLLGKWIEYDDAMFVVCRTTITPAAVLRDFAALVARDNLATITKQLGGARAFLDAVDFISAGGADDDPDTLAEHAEKIQKFMVSALAIEGPGDYDKPERIAAYESLLKACKCVRGATKADPGEAAYSASNWAYRAAKGSSRDKVGAKHRGQLAKIFKASE